MARVLFFMPYSQEAAGCRFRVHQFVPFLEQHGIECELRELVTPDLYAMLYKPGNRALKAALFARRALARVRDLMVAGKYDALFVYRECFPFGPALLEAYLRTLGKPIIYDFDDAIYLRDANPVKDFLRRPTKTNDIVQLADEVIVCNEQLRGLCAAYNRNVTIIPTSVDTDVFAPRDPRSGDARRPLRLGWIGSHSTAKYLDIVREPLQRLAQRFPIEFLVVGAGQELEIPGVNVLNKPWTLESEVDDFKSLDIGVYPLVDSLWELGKTSFKTIQYMAVGVPGVVSRVGAANEIVVEGKNGLLAGSSEEWFDKLVRLASDPPLRRQLAEGGRKTAVGGFSIRANAPRLLDVINRALSAPGRRARR
jgi:glycosyltransferase involved in cell wall biosynthesis